MSFVSKADIIEDLEVMKKHISETVGLRPTVHPQDIIRRAIQNLYLMGYPIR